MPVSSRPDPGAHTEADVQLRHYTTLRLGGPARRVVLARTQQELARAATDPQVLVLAGGSNVVLPDEGVDVDVVLVRTEGIRATAATGTEGQPSVELTVEAGTSFDDVVAHAVSSDLAGLECLSGIPGSTGATPVQNVGAYGQEVAETVLRMRVLDRRLGEIHDIDAASAGFGYRTSRFKGSSDHLLLQVTFGLRPDGESPPLRFGPLTDVLGCPPQGRAPLAQVRRAVLGLRSSKGMVVDPDDRDTWSAGSFFTNPVVEQGVLDIVADATGAEPPRFPAEAGRQKTSAAWLIQHAGFVAGYGFDGVGLSSRHTLALTNRGSGTTAALLRLAREIRDTVDQRFGIRLVNEPLIIGADGRVQEL